MWLVVGKSRQSLQLSLYTVEVGHDHVRTKSGRIPYIEILYHFQVKAKKPWKQFQRTVLKYRQMKILAQYPRPSTLSKANKISETLLGDAFLEFVLSHHCNRVAMIPVIDLSRNLASKVRFSFAGFVHVSHNGARTSVQCS